MGTSDFRGRARQHVCMLDPVLFAVCAVCLLLPFYRIEQGGHAYFYAVSALLVSKTRAILLIAAPALGLALSLVYCAGWFQKHRAATLSTIHMMGLVLLLVAKSVIFEYGSRFYSMAFGAVITMTVYAIGLMVNGLVLLRGRKNKTSR